MVCYAIQEVTYYDEADDWVLHYYSFDDEDRRAEWLAEIPEFMLGREHRKPIPSTDPGLVKLLEKDPKKIIPGDIGF